jgi:signal peptidase II
MRQWFWGPLSLLGLTVAVLAVLADQASKLWLLFVYDVGAKGTVTVTPFFDLVLVWNRGISYGLLTQDSQLGRLGLIAFACAASLALIMWLARVTSGLTAAAIGLIIGGAVGNAIDRIAYGAVADFFAFHAFGFEWYVFNIADVAIVAGVIGLLYDSMVGGHKKAGNPSKM